MKVAARLISEINRLNPTSYGRNRLMEVASKLGLLPETGVHSIGYGLKMQLSATDFVDLSIYFDSYEYMVRKVLTKRLRHSTGFLDIGANIGYYSLIASRLMPSGAVYAVEANPNTLQVLRRNLSLNHCANVEVFPFAVSDYDGVTDMFVPLNDTHGGAALKNHDWEKYDKLHISVHRLDDKLLHVPKIDLVKIDIEGAEMHALRGGRELLKKHKPVVVSEMVPMFLEKFGEKPRAIIDFMLSIDPRYMVYEIGSHGVSKCDRKKVFDPSFIPWGNYLFSIDEI